MWYNKKIIFEISSIPNQEEFIELKILDTKMKILVTGYKGYIGSHLYNEIKKDTKHEVHGVDLKDGDDVLYWFTPMRPLMLYFIFVHIQEWSILLSIQVIHYNKMY